MQNKMRMKKDRKCLLHNLSHNESSFKVLVVFQIKIDDTLLIGKVILTNKVTYFIKVVFCEVFMRHLNVAS